MKRKCMSDINMTYKISKLCFLFAFLMLRVNVETKEFRYRGHGLNHVRRFWC